MKRIITLFCLSISLTGLLHSQNQQWMVYNSDGNNVTALLYENDIIWAATQGGLIKFDPVSCMETCYTEENSGLPRNWITCFASDLYGNKWMATYNGGGLTKFDGLNWTTYDTSNSCIPCDCVGAILADENGVIWMSCGGLTKFDGTCWTTYNSSNSELPPSYVTSLAIDPNGLIWIGTEADGLVSFDGTNWRIYDTSNSGLPSNSVTDIAVDENGSKWVSTSMPYSSGLTKYDGTKWINYRGYEGFPYKGVRNITFESNGMIWGSSGSLVKFDGTTFHEYTSANSGLPYNQVTDIVIDPYGIKWIGTYYFGLVKFDNMNWAQYNISNSGLPTNHISSIAIDREGTKWIGIEGTRFYEGDPVSGGLAALAGSHWNTYTQSNSGLKGGSVRSVIVDDKGAIWMSCEGLGKFDGTNWIIFDTANSGLPDNHPNPIVTDKNGTLWIGTFRGLVSFDGTNWTLYNTSNSGLPCNEVLSIASDKYGILWIGTAGYSGSGGLVRFDGTDWKIYNCENSGLHCDCVRALACDETGIVWIGTNLGLTKFDGTAWTTYDITNSDIPLNRVSMITADNTGVVWLSTWEILDKYPSFGGLTKFDGSVWTTYTTSNSSLPDNKVTSVTIDSDNTKWIGTREGGLVVFNETGIPYTIPETNRVNRFLLVCPNPAMIYVNIETPLRGTLSCFNIRGQQIFATETREKATNLDVHQFPPGIYFLKLTSHSGVISGKFIKQ